MLVRIENERPPLYSPASELGKKVYSKHVHVAQCWRNDHFETARFNAAKAKHIDRSRLRLHRSVGGAQHYRKQDTLLVHRGGHRRSLG